MLITCYRCKCEFTIPNALYTAARASDKIGFWCPYGHEQHFPSAEAISEYEKIRRERDRLAQRLAQKDDDIRLEKEARLAAERSAAAARGLVNNAENPASMDAFDIVSRKPDSECA